MKSYRYTLQDLDCANCAKKIEDKITSNPDYKDVIVNFSTQTLSFKTDEELIVQLMAVTVEGKVGATSKYYFDVEESLHYAEEK